MEIGFEGVQRGEAVLALTWFEAEVAGVGAARGEVAVTDVVDEAGETVDGHQVVTPGAGQEERSHGEVLVRGLVERGGGVGARLLGTGHCIPPDVGTAKPRRSWRFSIIAVISPVLHC